MSSPLTQLPVKQLTIRLPVGIKLSELPNLSYMLQLMACLEAINSALRWLGHTEKEASSAGKLDKFLIWNVGAGWCAEAFLRLQDGKAANVVDRAVFGGQEQLLALWDRITAVKKDELISKIHRIRNKHFAHFDPKVMANFIAQQSQIGATEPFFLWHESAHPLMCRFLWPTAASILDLFPEPTRSDRPQRVDEFLDDLAHIWTQTANLLTTVLEAWILGCGCEVVESEWKEST